MPSKTEPVVSWGDTCNPLKKKTENRFAPEKTSLEKKGGNFSKGTCRSLEAMADTGDLLDGVKGQLQGFRAAGKNHPAVHDLDV